MVTVLGLGMVGKHLAGIGKGIGGSVGRQARIESCLKWEREVLRGHFKKCVTINILCPVLVTLLLVTNQRLSACQAPFPIIHMISKFSIICT